MSPSNSQLSTLNSPLIPPGYKQTEVGVIPEEWGTQTGEQLTTLIGKGGSPRWQGFDYANEGMLFVTSENVRDGFLDIREPKYLPLAFHEKLKRTKLQKHDILINLVGASIGRSCQLLQDLGEANVNQAVAVFRVKEDFCSEFIASCFQAPTTIKRILEMQVDAARPNISLGDLRRFMIQIPPALEQRAIAEALSDVDGLLDGLDQLIAKKRDIKQAAMQQLLTGQTRLPGFHGEWEVKRLGDVVDTDPENLGTETRPDFTFNYIALEDVDRGVLQGYSEQVFANAPSRARRKLRTNDVLVSTVRPNLQSHLLFVGEAGHWVCSTGFCVVRCREGVTHPGYVFFHFFAGNVNRQIDALLTGSNYPAINSGDVRALQLPVPGYDEQTAIAEVLTEMDAELAVLEQRREKTRALKQAMMQELLTGRTRLA